MSIELQNAFEISKAERRAAPVDTRVREALAAGRFVLVAIFEAYCPRTDAILGFDRHFQGAFDTRAEAQDALEALWADVPDIDADIVAPPVYGCDEASVVREDLPF
jgi:hypothetical protein